MLNKIKPNILFIIKAISPKTYSDIKRIDRKIEKLKLLNEGSAFKQLKYHSSKASPLKVTKKEIKEIRKDPNWRLNGESLAKIWIKRYGDAHKILKVIDTIASDDVRFNGSRWQEMDKDIDQYNAMMHTITKAADDRQSRIRSVLNRIFSFFRRRCGKKAMQKRIALDMVGLLKREDTTVKFDDQKNVLTQKFGHVQEGKLVEGRTISAEVQNIKFDARSPANLGMIKDDKGNIILIRSARTDNKEKIDQKSLFDIVNRINMDKKNPSGMKKLNDNTYEYRRVDVTFMDESFIKAAATTLKSLWTMLRKRRLLPIQDEQNFYNNKLKAIDELWSKKEGAQWDQEREEYYLERKIDDITVREYRPIVINHIMSPLAEKKMKTGNINYTRLARQKNLDPLLKMLETAFKRNDLLSKSGNKDEILRCIRNPTEENLNKLVDLLAKTPQNLPQATADQYMDIKSAFDCLKMCIKGVDESGKSIDNVEGSAMQFIATSILANVAQLPIGIECKSGNDRTAVGMGILCAQKEFRETKNKFFLPSRNSPQDEQDFAKLLTKYMKTFARTNVLASRGMEGNEPPVLKCKKSPVFWAIVAPIIPKDEDKVTYMTKELRVTIK